MLDVLLTRNLSDQKSVLIGLVSSSLLVFILLIGFCFYLVQFCRRELTHRTISWPWIGNVILAEVVTTGMVVTGWVAVFGSDQQWNQTERTGFFISGFVMTIITTLMVVVFLPQYVSGFDQDFLYLMGEKIELWSVTKIEQTKHLVILFYRTKQNRDHKVRWIKTGVTGRFIVKFKSQILVKNSKDKPDHQTSALKTKTKSSNSADE